MATTSTREALLSLAVKNGWTVEDLPSHHERTDSFVRNGEKIQVRYSSAGGLVVVGRSLPGDRYMTEVSGPGKAGQVRKLLSSKEN